ncbi:MAG: dTDP-4-dehydrorhamnose 3,5-epimerase [Pseudomonadota bacterium]
MKFVETNVRGVHLIDVEPRGDSRGFFARIYCAREFGEHGLEQRFVQVNNSVTAKRGTLRGMHYQLPPSAEVKIVRCIRGSLYDVVLDLRPDSPTFGLSVGVELTAVNRRMMYVPKGCAHGFLSLEDHTEAIYFVSDAYSMGDERGVRFNDPTFRMAWPFAPTELSDKDRSWPDYNAEQHGAPLLRGLV